GQLTAQGLGIQRGFNWDSVALSAISAGLGQGLPVLQFGNAVVNAAVHAAMVNALTQGIGVVTGLQKSFDWHSVAASAVGAGVGQAVSGPIGNALGKGSFGARLATGLIAGTA